MWMEKEAEANSYHPTEAQFLILHFITRAQEEF